MAFKVKRRKRTKRAAVDVLKERAVREGRECAECQLCPHSEDADHPACGWRQGLLLQEHSPEALGVVLTARELPGFGPAWSFQRMTEGTSGEDIEGIVEAFSGSGMLCLLGGVDGAVSYVAGTPELLERFNTVYDQGYDPSI